MAILIFSLDSVVAAYPQFAISDGNNYGPSDGKLNGETCRCKWTYNTIGPVTGPCVKPTLREALDVITYDSRMCDGGPELLVPREVNLLPHLIRIDIPSTLMAKVGEIPEEYRKFVREVKTGGKRRKTLRRKRKTSTRKRMSSRHPK